MSSSTTIHAFDIPVSEHLSEKFAFDSASLPVPPHVLVRARGTTEGIEMNFLGHIRSTAEPTSFENDDSSITESEISSKKEWAAVVACGLCLFLSGWQDGSLGPLIPTIQEYYNLSFTVISVLFVSGCLGFLLAAILNIYLSDRLGFGSLIFLGGVCQAISYAILVPAPPFPVMALAFVTKGFGIGLQDALANGFVGALRNDPSTKMGIIHSLYGVGALISPVIATQFAYHTHWSYHYVIPLSIASLNLVFLFYTFGFHTQEELLGQIQSADVVEAEGKEKKYKQVFESWAIQIVAIFCLLYVGAETTLGGWIVTFVVEERGGHFSAGYISSGFYGGLMLGRIGLIWLNQKVGERRVVYAYLLLAIGLEMTVWMLPNLIGNATAFALVGVFMGQPMYPISMNILGVIVPKWLLTGSMGWVASIGQVGGALFPFLTGTLIQKHGVHVLQPILVALLGGMLMSWTLVPSSTKRRSD
ncbi:MFS general substrate transporter [Rhizoctonia solani AG-3 Rhs1AP]|uniref:MFS general substrate transporter n=1 Tax=Rhizoctonia solani AG-3 Rhs1AP TaxID=1086054 RepID=X8J7W0_9AGAM|nr:MFS general substrate transporter [Rhizoctonia solani AG-3 Rhs1AP]